MELARINDCLKKLLPRNKTKVTSFFQTKRLSVLGLEKSTPLKFNESAPEKWWLADENLSCWGPVAFQGLCSWLFNQPPPNVPPRNKGLIRPYEGKPMVNKPLIRPYFWGGYVRGDWLTSHNMLNFRGVTDSRKHQTWVVICTVETASIIRGRDGKSSKIFPPTFLMLEKTGCFNPSTHRRTLVKQIVWERGWNLLGSGSQGKQKASAELF